MTLHQQHEAAIVKSKFKMLFDVNRGSYSWQVNSEKAAAACSEISKEYAKGFAEYLSDERWRRLSGNFDNWERIYTTGKKDTATTDQLLSLYEDHLDKEKIK